MPKYNDFTDISEILEDYSNDVYKKMEDACQEVAKEGVKKLKKSSPKRTGDYSKGWRVKKFSGLYKFQEIIHNATDYQLTHLLEKPHLKRNGGKTTPKVHIYPVEQECSEEYYQKCVDIIKKEANNA